MPYLLIFNTLKYDIPTLYTLYAVTQLMRFVFSVHRMVCIFSASYGHAHYIIREPIIRYSPLASAYDNHIPDLSDGRRGWGGSFNFSWCLMHISFGRQSIVVRDRHGQLFLKERDGSSTRETMIPGDVNG